MSLFQRENWVADTENRPSPVAVSTLEDVMGSVQRHPALRETKRREILSALRVVARCIGRTPAEIKVVPTTAFGKQLAAVRFVQAGIEAKRWINIRSLTVRALTLVGATTMPGRHRQSGRMAEWETLRRQFPSSTYRIGLSRFINFCENRGVTPQQVSEVHFEEFRQSLESASLVRKPTEVYRAACRLWDKAGDNVPGWPSFRTGTKTIDRTYSFDWSTFPVSFQKDVETFLAAGGNRDIFAEDYVPSVRPATVLNRRKCIRQMATALASSGVPLDQITSLAALVKPDNAKSILRFFLERAGGTPKDSIYGLACLLRSIARYWVRSHDDLPKLDVLCRALAHKSVKKRGMKERNRRRLRQFDDERNLSRLLHFPAKLFQLGRKGTRGKYANTYAMYGVATEILLRCAIRINNVVNLKVGTNIILPADRKNGRITLWLHGDDVKNGSEIEMLLPASTSKMIMSYLEDFRPKISATASDWLFPNSRGERRNVVGFSHQISVLIDRHADLEMHAHLFRHFAVKLLEEDEPGSAELGRRLLAHKNIQTTLGSYSEGKTKAAHQQFEEIIEARRAGTGNAGKPKAEGLSKPRLRTN